MSDDLTSPITPEADTSPAPAPAQEPQGPKPGRGDREYYDNLAKNLLSSKPARDPALNESLAKSKEVVAQAKAEDAQQPQHAQVVQGAPGQDSMLDMIKEVQGEREEKEPQVGEQAPEPEHKFHENMEQMKHAIDQGPAKILEPQGIPSPPPQDDNAAKGIQDRLQELSNNNGQKDLHPIPTPQPHNPAGLSATKNADSGIGGFVNNIAKGLGTYAALANSAYNPVEENAQRAASAAKGVALGAGNVMDMAQAAGATLVPENNPMTQAIAGATGLKTQPYESFEGDVEKGLTGGNEDAEKELKANPYTQTAKTVTELAPWLFAPGANFAEATEAAFAPKIGEAAAKTLGKAVHVAAGMGEGALLGALNEVQHEMSETGKVDPNKVLNSAIVGSALAAGGMSLKGGVQKLFSEGSEGLRAKLAKEILSNAHKAQDLEDAVLNEAHEAEMAAIKGLNELFGPSKPISAMQAEQKQMLQDVDYSLRVLAKVPSIWDIETPAQVGALETLIDSGYIGWDAIQDELRARGYAAEPLLLEMRKQIIPPSPRQRFQALEQEMRDLDAKEKAVATKEALEGQHVPSQPNSEPVLPDANEDVVDAESVREIGSSEPNGPKQLGGVREESDTEYNTRVQQSPQYQGVMKRLREENPEMSGEALQKRADVAAKERFPGLMARKSMATEPGRLQEAQRELGKWPASAEMPSSYIPLQGRVSHEEAGPTADQLQRVEDIQNAQEPEWKGLLPKVEAAENAIDVSESISPAVAEETAQKVDQELGEGAAEAIKSGHPGDVQDIAEKSETPTQPIEEPEEPETEGLTEPMFYGKDKGANLQFPSATEARLWKHATKIEYAEQHGVTYKGQATVSKSLKQDLGLKTNDEADILAKAYKKRVDDAAKKVASKEVPDFPAPNAEVPDNFDRLNGQELINKFYDLGEAADKAKGPERERLEKKLADLQEYMENRAVEKSGKKPAKAPEAPKTTEERAEDLLKAQKPEATKEELKATIEAVNDAGQDRGDGNGVFRRTYRGPGNGGFQRYENGIPFENTKGFIPDDLHKKGSVALNEIAHAKMALMIAEDDFQHSADNAYTLARGAEHERIKRTTPKELHSEPQAEKDKITAAVKLEQDRADLAEKSGLEAEEQEFNDKLKSLEALKDKRERASQQKELRGKITAIHEKLREINDRLGTEMSMGEHLHVGSNPEALHAHAAKTRKLPGNFNDAIDQAEHDQQKLTAAQMELTRVKDKHHATLTAVKDAYKKAVENVRPNSEFESPTWATEVPHPQEPSLKATVATQLQFNPETTKLHGDFLKQRDQLWDKMAARMENLWRQSVVYKVAGKAFNMTPQQAQKFLIDRGLMDPRVRRGASLALFGGASVVMSAGQAAEAAGLEDMDPKEREHLINTWGLPTILLTAAATVALGNRAGVPALRYLYRKGGWYAMSIWKNASEHMAVADDLLGTQAAHESLEVATGQLRGALVSAHAQAHGDHPEYLAAATTGRMSGQTSGKYAGKELTENGLRAVQNSRDAIKIYSGFIKKYKEDQWDPYLNALPESSKTGTVQAVNDVINYTYNLYAKSPGSESEADRIYMATQRAYTHGLFVGRLKSQLGAWVGKTATSGTLGLGSETSVRVLYEMQGNPVLAKALETVTGKKSPVNETIKDIAIAGPISGTLSDMGDKAKIDKPLTSEVSQSKFIYTGSAYNYFMENAPEMENRGFTDWKDFLQHTVEGDPDDPLNMDFYVHAGNNLAEIGGHDLAGIERDFIQRSTRMRSQVMFTTEPFRESQLFRKKLALIVSNAQKGDAKATLRHGIDALAFILTKTEQAGKYVIPPSLAFMLYNWAPTQQAILNAQAILDKYSVVRQTLGRYPGAGFDPLLPIGQGVFNDITEDWGTMAEELIGSMAALSNILGNIHSDQGFQGVLDGLQNVTTGSSTDPDVKKARSAYVQLFRYLMTKLPKLYAVGSGYSSYLGNAVPHLLNGEYETSVGRMTVGGEGGGKSLYPLKAKSTYTATHKTNAEGKEVENEAQMQGRILRDAIAEALGFKSPTASDIEDLERLNLIHKERGEELEPLETVGVYQ